MTIAAFLSVVSIGLLIVLFVVGDGADGAGVHGALSRRGVVLLASLATMGLVAMWQLGPMAAAAPAAWGIAAAAGGVVFGLGRLGLRWLARTDGARELADADLLAAEGRWVLPPTAAQPVGLVRVTAAGAERELRARWADDASELAAGSRQAAPLVVDGVDADGVLRMSPR